MIAVVKSKVGKGHVEIRDIEIPKIGPGEVLIRTKAAPIGSDVKVYHDDPVMRRAVRPPVVLGSENSGEVVEVGANVTGWEKGDRIVSEFQVSTCGECQFCNTGKSFLCPKVVTLGRGVNGSFAEYFKVPAKLLHRIPDGLSFEAAALAEDTATAILAITQAKVIELGDTVTIFGPGPMGLLSLQIVKALGAGNVIITGLTCDEDRLRVAKDLGADVTINVERDDPLPIIDECTQGEGVDTVILAVGSPAAIDQAFNVIRRLGNMVVIGFPEGSIQVPWHKVYAKVVKIYGSLGAHDWRSWERALRCISSGAIKVSDLITHKLPLDKWRQAFEIFDSKEGIKVELVPE